MSVMVQIRNVPEGLHRRLKARAVEEGMSMSAFILRELEKSLAVPPGHALLERIASRPPVELDPGAAALLREERERR